MYCPYLSSSYISISYSFPDKSKTKNAGLSLPLIRQWYHKVFIYRKRNIDKLGLQYLKTVMQCLRWKFLNPDCVWLQFRFNFYGFFTKIFLYVEIPDIEITTCLSKWSELSSELRGWGTPHKLFMLWLPEVFRMVLVRIACTSCRIWSTRCKSPIPPMLTITVIDFWIFDQAFSVFPTAVFAHSTFTGSTQTCSSLLDSGPYENFSIYCSITSLECCRGAIS